MRRPRELMLGFAGLVALAALAALGVAGPAAAGPGGMVVTSQPDAARAGVEMLEAGGNAVDAAVATAFALSVTQPFSAGLGGGAFALIYDAKGTVAIDARETAPAAADRDMYVREGVPASASLQGGLAVGTPGFVRGMALALSRYGTFTLPQVLAPAIRLAQDGFAIGPYHTAMLKALARMGFPERFPETAAIQFPPTGTEPAVGWVLRQPDLASTLRRLAKDGPDAFYTGDLARRIAAEVKRGGGILTEGDLAAYRSVVRGPVTGTYRGVQVLSFPPPSSGGVALVEMLNVLEGFDLSALGAENPAAVHRVVESMVLAFADRAVWLGDPDFVNVPVAKLTAKDYAAGLRRRIDPPWWRRWPTHWGRDEAIDVEGPGLSPRDAGTAQLSVVDAHGGAVSLTMTINTPFGCGLTVPGTGIVLNNEMDDFSKAPDRPNVYGLIDTLGANSIAPGKRPLSSMSPTILVKDGHVAMVTGSPGGPRIITTTLLTILNVRDWGMSAQQSVAAPRYHDQWVPKNVFAEPALPAAVVAGLRKRGHQVVVEERPWGNAQVIVVDPATGRESGGADPRGDGVALAAGAPK